MRRAAALALAMLAVITANTACAGVTTGAGLAPTAASTTPAEVTAQGTFTPATPPPSGSVAFAYDPALVPAGASAQVTLTPGGDRTDVRLSVSGLRPNRTYGAHLHVKPCGTDPKTAGPHYQHTPDPGASQSPSTDSSYANRTNEVWLDFTTDASGNAVSSAQVPWVAMADRQPKSLVIHSDTTMTAAGKSGTAGARVACLSL